MILTRHNITKKQLIGASLESGGFLSDSSGSSGARGAHHDGVRDVGSVVRTSLFSVQETSESDGPIVRRLTIFADLVDEEDDGDDDQDRTMTRTSPPDPNAKAIVEEEAEPGVGVVAAVVVEVEDGVDEEQTT